MINKKVISLVLSLALIVSCFASLASLGVYAIDNTKKTTSLQTAPVVTTTTAEKKMADGDQAETEEAYTAVTRVAPARAAWDVYPVWHCACGNCYADPTLHNDDTTMPTTDIHYRYGADESACINDDGKGCDGTLLKWTAGFTASGNKTGNYYLTDDITTGSTVSTGATVAKGQTTAPSKNLRIDLNGHNYTYTGSSRVFSELGRPNSHLVITDTVGGSVVEATNTTMAQGGIVWLNTNYSSNATDTQCKTYSDAKFFGGKYVVAINSDKHACFAEAVTRTSIYAFDAEIDCSACTTSGSTQGGTIRINGAASNGGFYGCTVKGGTATNSAATGGNIFIGNIGTGTVNIVDSVISGGKTATSGGNIFFYGSSRARVTRTDVLNGTAGNGDTNGGNGGNLAVGGACDVILTDCYVSGGKAEIKTGTTNTGNGGNLIVTNKGFTATGTIFEDGTAENYGGNIQVQTSQQPVFTNCTFKGGSSTKDANGSGINNNSSGITKLVNCTAIDSPIRNFNELTIEGGSYTGTDNSRVIANSKELTMTDATVHSDGTFPFINDTANSVLTATNSSFTSTAGRGLNNGTTGCDKATATLNNCTVSGADEGVPIGGSILNYAILTINGGTIGNADATVTENGGAICNASPTSNKTDGGKLYINGNANIIGGTATEHGGAIYNTGGAYLEINDGVTVSGGTATDNGGNIYNNATLVMNGATVTGGQAGTTGKTSNGGNIYNTANGTSNITDCIISDGKSTAHGGNVFVGGDMNFVNCTITGGEALSTSGKGGNLSVSAANTTANLTDCTISNAKAHDNGGAMYISNSATTTIVNINGCTFTGNEVIGTSKFGGDMFIGAAIVNIGASETNQTTFTGATSEYRSSTTGYTVLDNSIATNSIEAHVTIKDETEVSNILPRQVGEEGIIIKDTATVEKVYVEAAEFTVNGTTYDYVDKLLFDFSDNTATQTVAVSPWRASNLRIDRNDFAKAPSNVSFNLLATDYRLENDGTFYDLIYVTQTRTQCVCGGKAAGVGDHACDNTVVFTEWYDPESLPTSGNYYLTNNVNIDTKITTGDLNLDLNGFDIKKTAAVVLFEVPVGNTFNLTDTEGTGSIDGDKIATASDGANILVKGTFNMFAGTIKDGYADGEKGGNVNVKANAVMNMYGGTIKDGNANKGGNICTDYNTNGPHGVLNMYAGSITGGTAVTVGGNIFMYDISVAYINGTVTGGTAPEKFGPDIYVSYRNDKIASARAGAQLTIGADAVVGTVDAMYPYTTVTVEEGAQVTTLNYNTFNAKRTAIANTAPTAEKIADTDNANSAFNNWYLLARGQKKTDGSNWIRFTSLVDSDIESYYAAGYFITVQGEETADMETHDVYKTNYESGVEKQIGDYSLESDYYFHVDLEFSAEDIAAGKTITIKPYLCDNNGNYYYGAEKTVSLAALFPPAGE